MVYGEYEMASGIKDTSESMAIVAMGAPTATLPLVGEITGPAALFYSAYLLHSGYKSLEDGWSDISNGFIGNEGTFIGSDLSLYDMSIDNAYLEAEFWRLSQTLNNKQWWNLPYPNKECNCLSK